MTRRRELRGFAQSIAHKFSCSAEHYAFLAMHHNEPTVTIDLLTVAISPSVFDIERNRILAGFCRENLLQLVKKLAPVELQMATLTAWFDNDNIKPHMKNYWYGWSRIVVELTDESGRSWTGEVSGPQFICP